MTSHRRIVVAHDLDGCHFNFVGAFCARMARVDPANAEMYMAQAWPTRRDFYKNFGWDTREFLAHYADAMDEGLLADVAFTHDDTVAAAHKIKRELAADGIDVESIVATDRSVGAPGAGEDQTHEWIAGTEFPAERVIITADKTEVNADYFVEDTIGNYEALRAAGTECYLIRRPWNEDPNIPAEHYVDTMDEFADKVIASVKARHVAAQAHTVPTTGSAGGNGQGRVPRGVPTGGQFAATARTEAAVAL